MIRGAGPPRIFAVMTWLVRLGLAFGVLVLARKAERAFGEWALWTALVVGAVGVVVVSRWYYRLILRSRMPGTGPPDWHGHV